MVELILKEEVYSIMGAAMEVYKELGHGFLEAVYHEAFEVELRARNVPTQVCQELTITYKGRRLNKVYIADAICFSQVLVELKALDRLSGKEEAQVLNYLKATGLKVGLLINFGRPGGLEWKRFVY